MKGVWFVSWNKHVSLNLNICKCVLSVASLKCLNIVKNVFSVTFFYVNIFYVSDDSSVIDIQTCTYKQNLKIYLPSI